jgi:ABC-type Na+ efflux pump permease subunit
MPKARGEYEDMSRTQRGTWRAGIATLFAGLLLLGLALAGVTLAGSSDRQNAAITQYSPIAPFSDERGGDAQPNRRHGGGNGNNGYGNGSDPGAFKVAGNGGSGGTAGGGGAGEPEGSLAFTGFNLLILLLIGLLLLLIGSMLLMRDRAEQRAVELAAS